MDLDHAAEHLATAFDGHVAATEAELPPVPAWLPNLLALHQHRPTAHPYTLALALQALGLGIVPGAAIKRHLAPPAAPSATPSPPPSRPRRAAGRAVKVEGQPGWRLPGALPSATTAHVLMVNPAGQSRCTQRKLITTSSSSNGFTCSC